jgi:hypothetical protein
VNSIGLNSHVAPQAEARAAFADKVLEKPFKSLVPPLEAGHTQRLVLIFYFESGGLYDAN